MGSPYVNLDMRTYDFPIVVGYCPKPQIWNKSKNKSEHRRNEEDVEDNKSPSVRDAVFQTFRENKIQNATTKKEAYGTPLCIEVNTQETAALITDKVTRIILSKSVLTDHLEERVSSFLMQLIDCYDTDFHYTVGITEDQVKSIKGVLLQPSNEVLFSPQADTKIPFATAHHGTLPCIWAYPRDAWNGWKVQNNSSAPEKPQATVYMKNSDTYRLNNACTGLETAINQADLVIDGNLTERNIESVEAKPDANKKLREFAIGLLNQVALKEINPLQGFSLFLLKLQILIDNQVIISPDGDKKEIFKAWQVDIAALLDKYQNDNAGFVARLLGIRLSASNRETLNLETTIFPRYFKMLQRKNLYQNQLAAKVDVLKIRILALSPTKPNNFDKALKVALMKEAFEANEKVRRIFQRYFNCSGESLLELERECLHTCNPALSLVNSVESRREIKRMFCEFTHCVENFTIEELRFRYDLLKQIRLIKRISLRRFSEQFNQRFPNAHRLNYEQLRRIEIGCVKVPHERIENFASVLGVPPNIFFSNLCEIDYECKKDK